MRILMFLVTCLFFFSCTMTPEEKARRSLEVICKSDLKGIIENTEKEYLKKKPSYEIVSYKNYENSVYTILAEVDFHYMDMGTEINYKIVRKYRFHELKKKWERFDNQYQSVQYK